MKTVSESLFEKLCNDKNIKFEPIPTEENLRTPDYRIWLDSTEIIVEIKQMELNKDDLLFIEKVRKGLEIPSGFRGTGHLRIRHVIDDAYPQISRFSKGSHPSIIVVHDLTKGLSHLDYEDILNAMYGDEIVIINDTMTNYEEIDPTKHRFGGNRRVTKSTNRSLSAIALLEFDENNESIKLIVFHNIHAIIPINPQVTWQIADKQFIRSHKIDLYQYWTEITR